MSANETTSHINIGTDNDDEIEVDLGGPFITIPGLLHTIPSIPANVPEPPTYPSEYVLSDDDDFDVHDDDDIIIPTSMSASMSTTNLAGLVTREIQRDELFPPPPEEGNLCTEIRRICDLFRKTLREDFRNYAIPSPLQELREGEGKQLWEEESLPSQPVPKSKRLVKWITAYKGYITDTFQRLMEAEEEAITHLDTIQSLEDHRTKLRELYDILDDPELEQQCTALFSKAYKKRLSQGDTRKCFLDYFRLVRQHLTNIQDMSALNTLTDAPLCPLCFTHPIECAAIPCGHTFCVACLDRCDKCGVCRSEISTQQKIYIV